MKEYAKSDREHLPRVLVLYGGIGTERDVSLVSGAAVLQAIEGAFFLDVRGQELEGNRLPEGIDPEREIVLLALHGEFGEDGQVQHLLESEGIVYAGCDSECSELCMDKHRTKMAWLEAGLPVVEGMCFAKGELGMSTIEPFVETYGCELVFKPVSMGSSVGLTLIGSKQELVAFVDDPATREQSWLLERRIRGREFSVGVINGQAMGVVEICVPEGRVYDYEQKYHRSDTVYECPAKLSDEWTQRIQTLAESAFDACGCRDYARVDFLYDAERDAIYCLEINTLPGMTPQSLLPKSAAAKGYGFVELIEKMLTPAVSRFGKTFR